MAGLQQIVDDLRAESDELDALVAPLADGSLGRRRRPRRVGPLRIRSGICCGPTAVALTAVTDEPAFAELLETAAADPIGFVDAGADELAATAPAELLADWRATRARLHDALLTVPDGRKLPWFGPPMSAASMATARLMETWAHGLDVADTLGVTRPPTARLRSVAHIGVRTRDYAFAVNGLPRAHRAVSRRATRPRRQHLVVGAAGRRAASHRRRRGLLLSGHPAAGAARS